MICFGSSDFASNLPSFQSSNHLLQIRVQNVTV